VEVQQAQQVPPSVVVERTQQPQNLAQEKADLQREVLVKKDAST
jgi:hypothetical protein